MVTSAEPSPHSHKSALANAATTSISDDKSDKLAGSKKGTLVSSHVSAPVSTSAPTPAKSILALKYSEMYLLRILKIFLKTKSQKPKVKVPRK